MSLIQLGITGEWNYAVAEDGSGYFDNNATLPDGGDEYGDKYKDFWKKTENFNYPVIQLSPELIFADEVELLSIDFFGGRKGTERQYEIKLKDNTRTSGVKNNNCKLVCNT